MFSVCPNPNSYANATHNPAMSDCYIQACRILAGGCSGINTVSRVRVMVKVRVRDRRVNCQGTDVVWTSAFSAVRGSD